MNPIQYNYTGYAKQLPQYQPSSTAQDSQRHLSQQVPNPYNNVEHRVSYLQPQHEAPLIAEPPAAFIAELPAPLPPAPPTTTPSQQLNEDEILAHKLQNLEVEEARRRSSSVMSHQPSIYSLRDAASSASRTSHRLLGAPPPALPTRPHSESISPTPFYGPDSFGPPPASFGSTADGRTLMAQHGIGNRSPPTPLTPDLPEVVLPRVVLPTYQYAPAGLELVSTMSSTASFPAPASSLASSMTDPISLASYLELHREVPYPPQWKLPPVLDTLYGLSTPAPKAVDWLDVPSSREWRRIRSSQNAVTPTEPAYSFTFRTRSSGLLDARHAWSMLPEKWTYNLRFDNMTGMRKSELLTPPNQIDLITTYLPAKNYDSLRFIGPDGRVFLWVAHAPLSPVHGARYDTLRHALFMAPKGCDPLYGKIVADHAYWDGFIDYSEVHRVTCSGCGASPINGLCWRCKPCENHDICEQCRLANRSVKSACSFTLANLPDEVLYIRSSAVDPALICATLQIMRDWEFYMLRVQRYRDPKGFKMSEDRAREGDLGKKAHWRLGDKFDPGANMVQEQPKPVVNLKVKKVKAKELEKLEKAKEKERAKEKKKHKKKDKRAPVLGVSELIRGSAQVGGSVGDVGEALRRNSRDSVST
ncbi:hypothetical protein PMIN04_000173 [Paraphaeosphaeria minitans]